MADLALLEPLFRRLEVRDKVSPEEKQALVDAAGTVETYPAGRDMVSEGDRPTHSILLISGITTRYNILATGQRQITALHVSGDFVDLHGFLLKKMDHSVGALTECRVLTFQHRELVRITENYPHLTRLLWLLTLLDGAIHRQWLVVMGRMSAVSHIAHLICEMYLRLKVVGLAADYSFRFPLTQVELADTTGMSAVHVNRTLQELRGMKLLQWQSGVVRILDWEGLQNVGEFNPVFLFQEQVPR